MGYSSVERQSERYDSARGDVWHNGYVISGEKTRLALLTFRRS
jgi:hypothetical protein